MMLRLCLCFIYLKIFTSLCEYSTSLYANHELVIDESTRKLIGSGSYGAVYKQYALWKQLQLSELQHPLGMFYFFIT